MCSIMSFGALISIGADASADAWSERRQSKPCDGITLLGALTNIVLGLRLGFLLGILQSGAEHLIQRPH